MKKFYILVLLAAIVGGFFLQSADAYSRSHKKAKKACGKKVRNGKKQTVEQSLNLLKEYLPDYFSLTESDDEIYFVGNAGLEENYDDNSIFTDPILREKLVENINDWLGTPYRHGGHSKVGVDCSNFTSAMVEQTLGINFPRSPGAQSVLFERIKDVKNLQFGDLIFFSGRNKKSQRIGHVGFYLGDGLFAHSSSGRGVIYTHISQGYYTERFRHGGRFIKQNWASVLHLDSVD